ncbi:hypothetical protein ACQ4PT_002986 [Festuca glaucescens]
MARVRGKRKLQWIADRAKRNNSMKKRLPNLLKKTEELAVLCDVPVCLLVYLPGEDQPVVWPSQEAAADVVARYKSVAESRRLKHKLDGEDMVRKMVDKAKAELYKVHRERCEKEINLLLVDFIAGRRGSFADLPPNVSAACKWQVERKLHAVNARLQEIRGARGGAILPPLPPQLQLVPFQPAMAPPSPPYLPTPLLQDNVQDSEVPPPEDVMIVEPLAMVPPPWQTPPAQALVPVRPLREEDVSMMLNPSAYDASAAPMTLHGEPRQGSFLFEVLDACDVAGDGSGLPTTEELHAVFLKAGIFTAPQPNPSFDDPM